MPSATSQQLLDEIAALQAAQTEFMKQLESLPPNSVEREKYLVGQINQVTQEKITKFRELYASSDYLQQTVDANRDELNARAEILQLVEQQLAEAQGRINRIRNANINNLRMTEINTYYSDYYSAYLTIFRYIIYACVFLVLITLLRQRFILSRGLASGLAFIVVAVSAYFIWPLVYTMGNRNNLVFNEFDFTDDPGKLDLDHTGGDGTIWDDISVGGKWADTAKRYKQQLQELMDGECLGPSCCTATGLAWDPKTKKCTKEGFTNNQLTPAFLDNPETYSAHLVQTSNPGGKYYTSSGDQ